MSKDGEHIPQGKAEILDRFADHFSQRLNIPESLDRNKLYQTQQRPTINAMSEEPEFKELLDAIDGTSSIKPRMGVEYLLKSGSMEAPRFRRSSFI